MARAAREGWTIGLKTVRGAYMVQERHLALLQGQPCPVHDTAQATHDSYNRCGVIVVPPQMGSCAILEMFRLTRP